MTHTLTTDRAAAVATDFYYEPMSSCPLSTKVILLGAGGVAIIGTYINRDAFWQGWASLPEKRKNHDSDTSHAG